MRVIVVLGRVLNPRGMVVNRRVGRIFVNREEYITEPADRCALEVALQIKFSSDSHAGSCEVVVLPRGIPPDADVLRLAIATGADRAIHFAGTSGDAPECDDAATVRLLIAAIDRLGGADLVLTGASTLATGQGQLGPRLAEALGWPQVLDALQVSVSGKRLQAIVESDRRLGGPAPDYVTIAADLPCVVAIPAGALKPRYPDGVRLVNVYRESGDEASALEKWEVGELLESGMLRPVWERRGQRFPPERERGVRIRGTREEMARVAADVLRQRLPGRGS